MGSLNRLKIQIAHANCKNELGIWIVYLEHFSKFELTNQNSWIGLQNNLLDIWMSHNFYLVWLCHSISTSMLVYHDNKEL